MKKENLRFVCFFLINGVESAIIFDFYDSFKGNKGKLRKMVQKYIQITKIINLSYSGSFFNNLWQFANVLLILYKAFLSCSISGAYQIS
jgi:hypothetical protein